MNNITKETIKEAERFIKKAKAIPVNADFWSCKERAIAKRASLDLSEILVKFRQTSANDWSRK